MYRDPMTPEEFEKLEVELSELKSKDRPEIIKAIAVARAKGDLSENAEYHSAREKQGFIEARINLLEAKKTAAQIIDIKGHSGNAVQFGATVTIVDENTDKQYCYKIVGDYGADSTQNKISFKSPIARALMGKKKGDSVEVETPGQMKFYEVLDVEFV